MRCSQRPGRLVELIAIASVVATGVAGCEEGTGPSREIRMEAVTPTSLVGMVGQQVTPVPTVVVTDTEGTPLAGEFVHFSAGSKGTVAGGVVETDATGIAAPESWTLGGALGPQSLSARVARISVLFRVTAEIGPPREIWVVEGHGQSGAVNTLLPEPIRVWVEDGFGHGIADAPVTFSVISGGGGLIGASPVTDSAGYVEAAWTLGPSEGLQEGRAQSGTVEGIFAAMATAAIP